MDHSTQQLIDKFKRNPAIAGMAIMNRINDSAKK